MRRFFTDRTPPDSAHLTALYDSHAANWRERVGKLETKLTSEAWRNDLVRSLHGNVLEIGVAAGDTLIRMHLLEHTITSYTGIDISPAMISESESVAIGLTIPVTLLQADAQDLSRFPDDSFDTVTASLVFCTIPDVAKALAEIARVCKPNGSIVMIEHVLSNNRLIAAVQRMIAPVQIRAIGCHLDRATVDTLLGNGFIVANHKKRLFGVIRYVIALPPA